MGCSCWSNSEGILQRSGPARAPMKGQVPPCAAHQQHPFAVQALLHSLCLCLQTAMSFLEPPQPAPRDVLLMATHTCPCVCNMPMFHTPGDQMPCAGAALTLRTGHRNTGLWPQPGFPVGQTVCRTDPQSYTPLIPLTATQSPAFQILPLSWLPQMLCWPLWCA